MTLVAPRTARLINIDDATLAIWADRGITRMRPEEAALMRSDSASPRRAIVRADDSGYVITGRITSSDDEFRGRMR